MARLTVRWHARKIEGRGGWAVSVAVRRKPPVGIWSSSPQQHRPPWSDRSVEQIGRTSGGESRFRTGRSSRDSWTPGSRSPRSTCCGSTGSATLPQLAEDPCGLISSPGAGKRRGPYPRARHGPPLRRHQGVRGGTAPRQPPQGTHPVWPRGDSPPFVDGVKGGAVTPHRGVGRAGQCVAGACWWMPAEHRTGKGEEVLASNLAQGCEGEHSIPSAATAGVRRGNVPRQPRGYTVGKLAWDQ